MTNKQTLEKIKELMENEKHFRWARFWEGMAQTIGFIILWSIVWGLVKIFNL